MEEVRVLDRINRWRFGKDPEVDGGVESRASPAFLKAGGAAARFGPCCPAAEGDAWSDGEMVT